MKISLKFIAAWVVFLGIGFYFLTGSNALAKEPLVIKIRTFRGIESVDPSKEYKYQLLELIFSKTQKTDGPFRIEVEKKFIAQARALELVNQGDLSLIMTMTSKEREHMLHPIRIPIFKGLYGYRIAIIKKGDQKRFTSIQMIDEFKKLWAGQGAHWPDTTILQANGFQVVGGTRYLDLFDMLKAGRFDYFPRGLHEPWKELEDLQTIDFVVEKHLAIHYPAPGYIFTAKQNKKLADRIKRGFRIALQDGSFDQLFYNHPNITKVLKLAKLKERRIFRIENPLLSPKTPLKQKNLWYSP